jgi:transcriptional regulator with XRE-family HTH domain
MSTKTLVTTMATKIREARQAMGLSQRDFGRALKLSDKAVSAYEVGRVMPTVETIAQISQLTSKPVGYFFGETGNRTLELQLQLSEIERDLLKVKRALQK